jgi:hypothetical protein
MISSRYGEIAAKTKNPKARAFLLGVFAELASLDGVLDNIAEDGVSVEEYNKQRNENIPKLQDKLENVYTEEERAAFAIEECLPINEIGPYGMRPAHYAAEEGNLELLTELIGQGADLTLKCNSGHTPRDKARRHGHIHILNYIDSLFPSEPEAEPHSE